LGFVPQPNLLAGHFCAINETQQNGRIELSLLDLTWLFRIQVLQTNLSDYQKFSTPSSFINVRYRPPVVTKTNTSLNFLNGLIPLTLGGSSKITDLSFRLKILSPFNPTEFNVLLINLK